MSWKKSITFPTKAGQRRGPHREAQRLMWLERPVAVPSVVWLRFKSRACFPIPKFYATSTDFPICAGSMPDGLKPRRKNLPCKPTRRAEYFASFFTRPNEKNPMSTELMTELLEAGVHFGHQTKRWNP